MGLSAQSRLWLAERFFAAFLLFLIAPLIIFLALSILATGDKPVFVTDEWINGGRRLRAHRFRTTGPGEPAFHIVRRVIRLASWEDIPALWNVACGEVRLRDIWPIFRR
jgi:lipopolysaccharide/colanic/teichoic acid biosynthesis glycosyltransferase